MLISLASFNNLYSASTHIGDRTPDVSCRYPERIYMHNEKGGRILDVTKPPFNAKGDGKADDTAALIAAFDYCLARADEAGWRGGKPKGNTNYTIYLPDGTYRVTDTIIYSEPVRINRKPNRWEQVSQIRYVGESRNKTIIRLDDHCKSFQNKADPKPVLSLAKFEFNNHKAQNVVRNMTINTGNGNPGAVGLNFVGANQAEMRNLLVHSPDRSGIAGIQITTAPTIGHHRDITIAGYDTGLLIKCYSRATHTVFEHITFLNQKSVGMSIQKGGSTSMRSCRFINAPLPLQIKDGGYCSMIDSEMTTTEQQKTTVDVEDGFFYGRRLSNKGYKTAVKRNGKTIPLNPETEEYTAASEQSPSPGKPLDLPAPDYPELPWFAPEQWACPEDYGAKAGDNNDDTEAVQAAFNSGKPMIYFPSQKYKTSKSIRVPASVKRVNGLFNSLSMTFIVNENAEDPVLFEDANHATLILQSARPTVAQFIDWLFCKNRQPEGAELFLSTVGGPDSDFNKNGGFIKFWARAVNSEGKTLPLTLKNGDFWFLGFKTERGDIAVSANNARGEFIGGTLGVHHPEDYFVVENNAAIWATAGTSGFGIKGKETILRIKQTDKEDITFKATAFPERPDSEQKQIFIPPSYIKNW